MPSGGKATLNPKVRRNHGRWGDGRPAQDGEVHMSAVPAAASRQVAATWDALGVLSQARYPASRSGSR
jgi:hypothetical protein